MKRKNTTCKHCYFFGDCPGRNVCASFTPVDDEGESIETEIIIHNGKAKFRDEWAEYIEYSEYPEKFSDKSLW